MRKIRLDLDDLEVESFATSEAGERRGTVVGRQTGVEDCGWSYVGTSCGDTVWEAGCSFVTAPIDCNANSPYSWCNQSKPYAWCSEI